MDPPPAVRVTPRLDDTSIDGGTLGHARDPPTPAGDRAVATAGVGDVDRDAVRVVAEPYGGGGVRTGMLDRIGERLLHDPVHGELDTGGQVPWGAVGPEDDGQPDGPYPVDQLAEITESGQRTQLRHVVVAQQAEQPAQLTQGLTAGDGHLLHRLLGVPGGFGNGVPGAVGEPDHDGEVVRDDV